MSEWMTEWESDGPVRIAVEKSDIAGQAMRRVQCGSGEGAVVVCTHGERVLLVRPHSPRGGDPPEERPPPPSGVRPGSCRAAVQNRSTRVIWWPLLCGSYVKKQVLSVQTVNWPA